MRSLISPQHHPSPPFFFSSGHWYQFSQLSLILLDVSESVSGGNVLPCWVDLDAAYTPSGVSNGRGISRIAASILKTGGVNGVRVQHTDKLL